MTDAQREWLSRANQFGTLFAGYKQGAVAASCVRKGWAVKFRSIHTGLIEYRITSAGISATQPTGQAGEEERS